MQIFLLFIKKKQVLKPKLQNLLIKKLSKKLNMKLNKKMEYKALGEDKTAATLWL